MRIELGVHAACYDSRIAVLTDPSLYNAQTGLFVGNMGGDGLFA